MAGCAVYVSIRFSVKRGDRQRAMWIAQELIDAFGDELAAVSLEPLPTRTFSIRCGDEHVWERFKEGGLPDAEAVKSKVRDYIERHPAPKSTVAYRPPTTTGAKPIREPSPRERSGHSATRYPKQLPKVRCDD